MSDKDDVRLLYQVLSSQIEFSKTQQWTMAYYTLLFIGGIVGFSELIYKMEYPNGGIVGFSELIYKMEYPNIDVSPIGLLASLFLTMAIPPIVTACVLLLLKNRDSMRECREKFQEMWSCLSWPFQNEEGHLGKLRLVGRREIHDVYRSTRYDLIFWFPAIFLTSFAGLFSYGYLLMKFWKFHAGYGRWIWVLLFANIFFALFLIVLVIFVYRFWDSHLKWRAQKKESE